MITQATITILPDFKYITPVEPVKALNKRTY